MVRSLDHADTLTIPPKLTKPLLDRFRTPFGDFVGFGRRKRQVTTLTVLTITRQGGQPGQVGYVFRSRLHEEPCGRSGNPILFVTTKSRPGCLLQGRWSAPASALASAPMQAALRSRFFPTPGVALKR
jgi:hypothetical protein